MSARRVRFAVTDCVSRERGALLLLSSLLLVSHLIQLTVSSNLATSDNTDSPSRAFHPHRYHATSGGTEDELQTTTKARFIAARSLPAAASMYPLFDRKFVQLGNKSSIGGAAPNALLATSGTSAVARYSSRTADYPQASAHLNLAYISQHLKSSRAQVTSNLDSNINNNNINKQQQDAISQQQQQTVPRRAAGLLEKICIGTTNRLSSQSHNKTDHYYSLVERYRNCTYVIGNLEITWLDSSSSPDSGNDLDLSFLESIREITGYLLIAHVNVDRLSMPNLQIIRGRDLFKLSSDQKEEFAMILIDNELRQLELPNLREILAGSIGSYNNNNLCHIRTINWDEILNWPTYKSVFVYNGTIPECAPCHPVCQGSCWAPDDSEMCQRFSKTNCSPMCGQQGRCYGLAANECCHSFCAGGCTGPSRKDCLACKNFYDDGECKQECPSMQRYNPTKFLWEPNPNGKYAFGATCVRECPKHLLRDNGACVRTCPPNKRSLNNECVACEKETCDKNCQGVEVVHSGYLTDSSSVSASASASTALLSTTPTTAAATGNSNTTLINNSSSANSKSQQQQQGRNQQQQRPHQTIYEPLHPSKLDVFETVREITGYLSIQAKHPDFKNLSMFRNLRTIGGSQTIDMLYALAITHTSLVSLNLRSLRKVRSGRILIEDNPELCFADTIDWSQINITQRDYITTRNNGEPNKCQQSGLQCHEQCARDGCWGPNANECLSCNNYKLNDYCVTNCSTTYEHIGWLSYDSGSNTCKKCHPECRSGCSGTEASDCWQCKRVKDGPYCKSECPGHKFVQYNSTSGVAMCQDCDKSCVDGCTGPSSRLGEGGCNSCQKAIINGSLTDATVSGTGSFVAQCIQVNETCPDGYYQEYVGPQAEGPLKSSTGKPVCRKCHHRCKSCTGMGTHTTVCECAKYVAGEQCEDYCPRDYYADDASRQCVKCSPECNGCFGPTEADCISCRVYRIYYDSTTTTTSDAAAGAIDNSQQQLGHHQRQFNCTAQCPQDKPHRISESNMLDPYCSEDALLDTDFWTRTITVLGSTTSILLVLTILASMVACVCVYRCQLEKDKTVKLTMHLSGIDDVEPLSPSHMKPNLAPLRSIKETELRKGNVLGSGFGGTVYQGFWYPEGQGKHKAPRPVAIKVLRDNGQSNNLNKEFLDEAYIMASVKHQNLVRLLAVCMTPNHFMLVTKLMPLGCLLEYVKKHKQDIGSKNLLEWGKQIASGMSYLEEHRMVHRDLALRNVLLQTSWRAMISDFGLAKFLDLDQSEYHSGGGRLPIKWLAPECIRERKFTHKSDVWAFGVTLWELVTFGQRPFDEYDTKDVPIAIEKGARLPQPSYVTADVYKCMYSCWFYNADDRPNFKQLEKSFIQFARDPERYLIWGPKMKSLELMTSLLDFDDDVDCIDGGDNLCEQDLEKDSQKQKSGASVAKCHRQRQRQVRVLVQHRQQARFINSIGGSSSASGGGTSDSSELGDCCDVLDDEMILYDEGDDDDVDDDGMDDDYDEEDDADDDDGVDDDDDEGRCILDDSSVELDQRRQQVDPGSMQPDLTPSTHNRLNEMRFGFEMAAEQQRRLDSSATASGDHYVATAHPHLTHHQHQHHTQKRNSHQSSTMLGTSPGTDLNNNVLSQHSQARHHKRGSHCDGWTATLATKSASVTEQPTDQYDYLLPSPVADGQDDAFGNICDSAFAGNPTSHKAADFSGSIKLSRRQLLHAVKPGRLNLSSKHRYRSRKHQQAEPPHSAGVLRSAGSHLGAQVTNEEYFLTLTGKQQQTPPSHYVNERDFRPTTTTITLDDDSLRSKRQQQQQTGSSQVVQVELVRQQRLSVSNGNIPHSLV